MGFIFLGGAAYERDSQGIAFRASQVSLFTTAAVWL